LEVRQLIRRMSRENALWGAPKIHGELLKLGFDISETSVGKYLVRRKGSLYSVNSNKLWRLSGLTSLECLSALSLAASPRLVKVWAHFQLATDWQSDECCYRRFAIFVAAFAAGMFAQPREVPRIGSQGDRSHEAYVPEYGRSDCLTRRDGRLFRMDCT
jgi:hypothetical protein